MIRLTTILERILAPRENPEMIPVKGLLLVGSATVGIGIITLGNAGWLPMGIGDFAFIAVVTLALALYRPGWAFLALVAMIPFEIYGLAPDALGIALRPYQLLAAALAVSLAIRAARGRSPMRMFPIRWFDAALVLVPVGGAIASVNATDPGVSLKLAVILLSYLLVYFLGRLFIRDVSDIRMILPFLLVSAGIVSLYAIVQNVRFLYGLDPFEVMPGRPNSTFPEPDWFGGYLIFAFASLTLAWTTYSDHAAPNRRYALVPLLSLVFVALVLSVSRSAWLGTLVAGLVATAGFFGTTSPDFFKRWVGVTALSLLIALSIAPFLTRFDLLGRAASTAGLQEITVSCIEGAEVPERVADLDELGRYGCRHIDLEEIGAERAAGNVVTTVRRPDPNVEIRRDIYGVAWGQIREHPLLGIGWGSIGAYLGTDERGAMLNASNMFLEVWLGSGLLGFLGFVSVWLAIPMYAIWNIRAASSARRLPEAAPDTPRSDERGDGSTAFGIVILSAWAGLTVFNLFNSGMLLGFFWVFLAVAVMVISPIRDEQSGTV